MGMLEIKTPALSKKVRSTSRLAICTHLCLFPHPPSSERAEDVLPSPPALQASWDLPCHQLILREWLEQIPP